MSGATSVQGVRPEILASWHRCRDTYGVDPDLGLAPGAPDHDEHHLEHDVVFAELGGLAATAVGEVERDAGIVTLTDGSGRLLAIWGDPVVRRRAEDSNLAPWAAWSERASGTNGMGTALESAGPVTVTGAEHWCHGFHQWACAGVAVRDVVTRAPIAALNVSRWDAPLSTEVSRWLGAAAQRVESKLRDRAVIEGHALLSAFDAASSTADTPIAGLDKAGRIVIADSAAGALLGVPQKRPMLDPTDRPFPVTATLRELIPWAIRSARRDPQWTGSTQLVVPPTTAVHVELRPVFQANHLVGMLCLIGSQNGEQYHPHPAPRPAHRPVIGVRDDRLLLLSPSEIQFAEADRSTVWLTTDRGRIQAAERGLENFQRAVEQHGFAQVHRRFVVNLRRVREIERGIKGELFLFTDGRTAKPVPVSRRHAPTLRRMLGV